MARDSQLVRDFLRFVRQEKKWWLISLAVLVLLALAAILLLNSDSGISWTTYTR